MCIVAQKHDKKREALEVDAIYVYVYKYAYTCTHKCMHVYAYIH